MDSILLNELNNEALKLFSETRTAFGKSTNQTLRTQSSNVPNKFVDEGQKIRIVFAGQYSAGKSSILSIMTGQKLEVGEGITTKQCNFLDWNGIEVVDTPGIHTQKRPDHDEITYKAMSESDLLVFVCTAEGFGGYLGEHFRKLLIEKGRGNEMMLVFNKMESSRYGNTEEGRKIFYEKDVLPVISPEYTSDDLFISYVDVNSYLDAQESSGEEKSFLMEMSGFNEFYENINRFIEKKKILGKCTTSLYKLEQMLSDALSRFKTGDDCADGSLNLLNRQRGMLVESQNSIKMQSHDIIRGKTQQIRNWGNTLSNELTLKNADEINAKIKQKYEEVNGVYEESIKDLTKVINSERQKLEKNIANMESEEFTSNLKATMNKTINDIKSAKTTSEKLAVGAGKAKDLGNWLSKFATGPNAGTGWNAIFKLGTYSGSQGHKVILDVGHLVGHKFKPWEAVKMASKVGKFGKILGVGGAFLGVAFQIFEDAQNNKAEKQLSSNKGEIMNMFNEAANTIDLKFDEETQCWIDEQISPSIADIDHQIADIRNSVKSNEAEFQHYHNLLSRTRNLIARIQQNI